MQIATLTDSIFKPLPTTTANPCTISSPTLFAPNGSYPSLKTPLTPRSIRLRCLSLHTHHHSSLKKKNKGLHCAQHAFLEASQEVETERQDHGSEEQLHEESKLFVGNLPYDVNSEKLAEIFAKAGTVEVSEVFYNRNSNLNRGFGFVTMSTVEEADRAVELLHHYELDGRSLTVDKALPIGTQPKKPRYAPFRIHVGNLPWDMDAASLEEAFSKHGEVLDARVICDRETGQSRGFGYVSMSSESERNGAIAAMDGQIVEERIIRVSKAEEKSRENKAP